MFRVRPPEPAIQSIFFHIPKTGGTTFRQILLQLYGDLFCYCADPQMSAVKSLFDRYHCVEFHVGEFQGKDIYFHRDLIQRQNRILLNGKKMFIMFRDPVERVISNYFQLKRKREEQRKPNAAETLEESLLNSKTHNKQVGYLLGYHPSERDHINRDDLENAKEILTELKMTIGITEYYAQSLLLLEAVTGRRIQEAPIPIENQTDRRFVERIDSKTRDFIREKNLLDQELYDFACKLFQQQCFSAEIENTRNFRFIEKR